MSLSLWSLFLSQSRASPTLTLFSLSFSRVFIRGSGMFAWDPRISFPSPVSSLFRGSPHLLTLPRGLHSRVIGRESRGKDERVRMENENEEGCPSLSLSL